MAYINFQPRPKIPPIGFFQPISVDPKDMMTDVEFLLGILKKLNETIAQVNKNTEFINEYSGKIEEIEAEIERLRNEMTSFEEQVENTLAQEFANIRIELQAMIASCLAQANAYTDVIAGRLEQQIEEIVAGQINVYDPTTGLLSPIQTVIDNLFNSSRNDALTATEYDTLDDGDPLSATAYDAYELTARDYDVSGKVLLV